MSGYDVPETKSYAVEKSQEASNDGKKLSTSHLRSSLSMKRGKYYYGVQIATGDQLTAGTQGFTYVTLIGDKGKTGKTYLRGIHEMIFKDPVSKQTVDNLTIVSEEDLGDILVVTVGCDDKLVKDEWYVDFVGVANLQTDAVDYFPVYHWLRKESSVNCTANTTTLRDVGQNKILLNQRAEQLKQRQELYQWQKFPDSGIPSGILDTNTDLPADEQFDAVKNFDFTTGGLGAFAELGVKSLFITADNLRAYEKLADGLGGDRPLYQAGRWATDVEFGRQMMNGVNPIVIQQCTKLPSNFPVTNDMVKPFLVRGLCLEDEMKAGHVYICDMKIMDGLQSREGYFNVAPICLLYVNGSGQLVPIAIQLKQGVKEEEKTNNPIFLPSDNLIDWLKAKIFYQCAHSQFHQIFTHYTSCHATMEAYAMGIQRNLPDPHPIFKLLRPHIRYTMAINSRARATLINDGGIIDLIFSTGGAGKVELMRRSGRDYNIHTSNIKKYAQKRGVDNPDQLPGYHYRDDGIKVWNCLEEYARAIINEFYRSDDDVKQDKELQNWALDTHKNGFPGYFGAPDGHGFPSSVTSREELTELCTLIMFTGSAQHASVNFLQYYYYQYQPNAPFGVRRPPPSRKGEADYQDLLETLPEEKTAVTSIGVTHLLSQYSQNEEFLGTVETRFREKEAERIIERFQQDLSSASGEILQRNEKLDMPYTGMLPKTIPNSITI